jgi:hypothetical protein
MVRRKPLSVIEKQEPAMTALIKIGPAAATAIMRVSPWNMGTDERQAAISAVAKIAHQMKDPKEEVTFLGIILAQANSERMRAEEGLKRLKGRRSDGR